MTIKTDVISVDTKGHNDMLDITNEAGQKLRQSGLSAGTVTFFVSGSTAGLSTVEYEPGLLKDIPAMFEKLAPEDARYHHDETGHDGNGNSHVRATLLGPSLVAPFKDGDLMLGTWQQIVLIDFDNRSRHRDVVMQIMGE